jgi:hypothetical protein
MEKRGYRSLSSAGTLDAGLRSFILPHMRCVAWIGVLCLCACARTDAPTRAPSEPPTEAERAPADPPLDATPSGEAAALEGGATGTSTPASSSPAADAAGLTGTWAGTYFYATANGSAVGSVAFFAEIVVDGGKLTGSVVEPNTIGDRTSSDLRATVEGSIAEDGLVRFVKTYDGTAGVDHSVEYVGRLDPVTQQIDGMWRAGGGEGRFVMRRHARLPELARR